MNSMTERAEKEVPSDDSHMSGATTALAFREALLANGILFDAGEEGLYGRSHIYEDVLERVSNTITRLGADFRPEILRFPPVLRRTDFEDSGYFAAFPNLAGSIHSFDGNDVEHQRVLSALDKAVAESHEDRDTAWLSQQKPTRLMLNPAACYCIYPLIGRRGACPVEGYTFDVMSYCFRHEPSLDPIRMQMFRVHEYVKIGTPEQVSEFREVWIKRVVEFMESLGLYGEIELASDPFFGRGGKVAANSQREKGLKFELLIQIASEESKTACVSFNYHLDYLTKTWKIATQDGVIAHSGCIGFGLERVTLALFNLHGMNPKAWPRAVRELLWGSAQAGVV
jgi:seryl-tRNA synthetase